MPPKLWTLLCCTLLGLTLVSGCGTTRGLAPPPPQIPVRQELRLGCEMLSTPAAAELPALAEGSAQRAQLEERAWWMQYDLAHNAIAARQCARYLELLGLVDGYNAAAALAPPR